MEKKRTLKSAICKGGHLQTSILESHQIYELNCCRECSKPIIDMCQYCNAPIIGGYAYDQLATANIMTGEKTYDEWIQPDDTLPNFCHDCGKPYPWTENFLNEYKIILELQSDEIDQVMQNKIYLATEEALKQKFAGNSLTILKLMFNKLSIASKAVMISGLSNVASEEIIKILTK